MCDEFSKIMHDEFEMSMMGELNFFLGLQIKQIEDGIFFNQSEYIKEMLKKFGLEDSKPMKTLMSSDTKLTKDEECESIDSTKYREFAQILDIPCEGACIFTDKWSLDELGYGVHRDCPFQTNPPSPDDIISSKKFNLAYFIAKRIEFVTKQAMLILPYGMLLTRLFKYVMGESPKFYKQSYVLYDRVIDPLTAQQERKTQYHGTRRGRHSTSFSSAFDKPSSFHLNDDDDDKDGNDEGTLRASTSSPTRFVSSLTNEIPRVF
nr:retrovirus-related Pol polyprotein from transposon TNT 1-94 [Tanacetum cinerariifolium]